jgi:hypothetical protein
MLYLFSKIRTTTFIIEPNIIKAHVTRIYAHDDGSYSVNVGVHISGCGGRI